MSAVHDGAILIENHWVRKVSPKDTLHVVEKLSSREGLAFELSIDVKIDDGGWIYFLGRQILRKLPEVFNLPNGADAAVGP
jgi:hypothetical protein